MPAIVRWSRSSGWRWRGWSSSSVSSSSGRAEALHGVVLRHGVRAQELGPRSLFGAELTQPQLAAVIEPHKHTRGAVAEGRTRVEELEAAGRHQVDEQSQVARLHREHLSDPADTVQPAPGEGVQRRVEGLQRHHARRQCRFHPRAGQPRRQAACGDLDLGQLGHASRLG